jgi:hypothetical protein
MTGLETTFDNKQWMIEELTIDTLYKHGRVNEYGVNVSMIDYMLKRTPHQRLLLIERHQDLLAYHQGLEPRNDQVRSR